MKWHVIHTKVRQEFRAEENLRNQGFEVFLPLCQAEKKQHRQLAIQAEPLFARYLFIRLSDVTSNWLPIRSTKGVSSLLRFGQECAPVSVPDQIIEAIKSRCADEEPLHTLFQFGEELSITDGPFKGFLGLFEKIQTLPDGLSRALILVDILGQAQRLKIPVFQLERLFH